MRRHEVALQKRSPMPLFRDRGSGPAAGRGNEPPPPPPTPKSSDLFSHDDPKNRNATCLPSLQPFHLPLSLSPFSPLRKAFSIPPSTPSPARCLWIERRHTSDTRPSGSFSRDSSSTLEES